MGTKIACGARDSIQTAISSGVIPKDSLIITNESERGELFFYDRDGVARPIAERSQFDSLVEAQAWAQKYDCMGRLFSVWDDGAWRLYVVQENAALESVGSGGSSGEGGLIETIKAAGTALPVVNKCVDIPGATAQCLGLVRGTDRVNGVAIADDFTMYVHAVNVNSLVQNDDDTLILDCGDAGVKVEE